MYSRPPKLRSSIRPATPSLPPPNRTIGFCSSSGDGDLRSTEQEFKCSNKPVGGELGMSTIGLLRALLQGDDCCGELEGVGKDFRFLVEVWYGDWSIFSFSSTSKNKTDFRGVFFVDPVLRLIACCVISCNRRADLLVECLLTRLAFDLGEKNRLKRRGVIGGGFFGLPAPDDGGSGWRLSLRKLCSMTTQCPSSSNATKKFERKPTKDIVSRHNVTFQEWFTNF